MTDASTPTTAPVLVWLELRGFRAFGTEPRRLDLDAPLTVVHGANSQGKSSLAEALEFLLTGCSSRRDLLGGAKAEYHESLRNAHLPSEDQGVWVAAGLRGSDGNVHEVRRELVCDFGSGTECESRLLVDGAEAQDLSAFGLATVPDSPVGAPVLLQHTLRHVLSTEPKQRVAYFKALLSLTDLDHLRERVTHARRRLENSPAAPARRIITGLSATPFRAVATRFAAPEAAESDPLELVREALLEAGAHALGARPTDLSTLATELKVALERQHEALFPLTAFSAGPAPADPAPVDLQAYSGALAQADRAAAALAPVFAAVLAVPALAEADGPHDCPVCATPAALTPERLGVLRDELRRGDDVESAAQTASGALRAASEAAGRIAREAATGVPSAGGWTQQQVELSRAQMLTLGLDEAALLRAGAAAVQVRKAAESVAGEVQALQVVLRVNAVHVDKRTSVDQAAVTQAMKRLLDALEDLRRARREGDAAAADLRGIVGPAVSARSASAGLAELLEAVEHADDLAAEVGRSAARAAAGKRLAAAEQALTAAASTVLDRRFDQMSDSITRWWLTIRPDELVAFAGVQRRARAANFVNLMASLRTDPAAEPVERHALGVFSDSQLNALGLSTFLARTELMATPLVVLDDPIPGSDGDHRFTFAQNTIDALLNAGTQVILTTYDDKLARLAVNQQISREKRTFELTLSDHVAGTEPTMTSDVFDQLMLEGEDNVNAPSAAGRRAASTTYRTAAERLAKQIIATARTAGGTPTSVADVEGEAKVLGDLVPLVRGCALDNGEKGQWTNFTTVLNPGNHDDEVPSNASLRQVRGNLRKIAKDHRKHWPGGLVH